MFTSGIKTPISYDFHLEQAHIIILGMKILVPTIFGLRVEDRKCSDFIYFTCIRRPESKGVAVKGLIVGVGH